MGEEEKREIVLRETKLAIIGKIQAITAELGILRKVKSRVSLFVDGELTEDGRAVFVTNPRIEKMIRDNYDLIYPQIRDRIGSGRYAGLGKDGLIEVMMGEVTETFIKNAHESCGVFEIVSGVELPIDPLVGGKVGEDGRVYFSFNSEISRYINDYFDLMEAEADNEQS